MKQDINLDELAAILARTNQPMGSSTGRAIYSALKAGKPEEAMTVYSIDGDKITQYPELQRWLLSNLGCRSHGVIGCTARWCQL